MNLKIAEWFLRISLSIGFLSACADRFGLWPKEKSAWGNWANFVAYTKTLLPFFSNYIVYIFALVATVLEVLFAILLLTNFKTSLIAKASGVLLLLFALSMVVSVSIKAPLDYSVFTAAAAAFALSFLTKEKNI
jgi:thiosulfate dehydrogenase (quinone) large subunit